MNTVPIGPLRVAQMTRAQAFAAVTEGLTGGQPLLVAFCNAHTATLAFKQPDYADVLGRMLVLNDGIGLDLAARLLGLPPFPDNLNGTDFVPAFLAQVRPLRVYLLGAKPAVLSRTVDALAARFPQHTLVGSQHGFFADADGPAIAARIATARADLVLCAMGNPRQEFVMAMLAEGRVAPAFIGVGALFDFLAGTVTRAPPFVRRMRMEFAFRLLQEPRRLGRRYTIEIAAFVLAVLRLRRDQSSSAPSTSGRSSAR